MEDKIMRKQKFMASAAPPPLSIHRDSRLIAKVKPKIRIIHIFTPEIIKTDVANFRELVQRLTGKPASTNHRQDPTSSSKRKHGKVPKKSLDDRTGRTTSQHNKPSMISRKMEPLHGLFTNTSHHEDYFSAFSDIDRFIQDISGLPLLPLDPSHHIHPSLEASQLT